MIVMSKRYAIRGCCAQLGETCDFTADEAKLDELKSGFKDALQHIPRDRPALYLDYPVHLNVGDILIMKGVEAAFSDAGHDICGRYSWMNFRDSVSDAVDHRTTIVFHGGGNFGDLYPVHQRFRERMLQRFRQNRIVVLPQTIHFDSKSELHASAQIFRQHPEITIMVRDRPSFTIARRHFSDHVLLVPDAAHYLWRLLPRFRIDIGGSDGELCLLRKDKESPDEPMLSRLGRTPDDWFDLIPRWTQRLFGLVCRMHMAEGLLDRELSAQPLWYRQSDFIVNHVSRTFSHFDAIRSNRLHACLLGLLLRKPATLLDNSYGKLRHYFSAWLSDMDGVHLER